MTRDADPLRLLAPATPRLSGLSPVHGEGGFLSALAEVATPAAVVAAVVGDGD